MNTREIAGEDIDAIGAAMQHFRFEPADEDGMTNIRAHAPVEELAPLFRALMRVEATMLLKHADDFPHTEESCRSDDRRRCDALVQISQQLTDALRPPA